MQIFENENLWIGELSKHLKADHVTCGLFLIKTNETAHDNQHLLIGDGQADHVKCGLFVLIYFRKNISFLLLYLFFFSFILLYIL